MEVELFRPKTVASTFFPMEEVRIIPICDTHIGAQGADLDRLKRTVNWGVEQGCYFIFVGDIIDVASPSNRAALRAVTLYDSVREMMDERMHQIFKTALAIFMPCRDRVLGYVSGDHLWEWGDGTTTETRLAQELGGKYMGDGAGESILMFGQGKGGQPTGKNWATCKIWFHHGKGWGESVVSTINQLQKIAAYFYADCYLGAHQHKKGVGYAPYLDISATPKGNFHYHAQERPLVACGGYLKGYQIGSKGITGWPQANYIEKRMLMPAALGGTMLFVRPHIKGGRGQVDVQVLV